MILWLARRDSLHKEKVWIQLQERRFPLEEEMAFQVITESLPGGSHPIKAQIHLLSPSGKKIEMSSSQNNKGFSFSYTPEEVGVYTLKAEVYSEKAEKSGSDETRFIVFRQNLEVENPTPDLESLKILAQESKGEYYPLEKLDKLLSDLEKKPSAVVIEKLVLQDLWDNAFFFLCFVILLGIEWFLRKIKGLS
jgi:hypothetical protein